MTVNNHDKVLFNQKGSPGTHPSAVVSPLCRPEYSKITHIVAKRVCGFRKRLLELETCGSVLFSVFLGVGKG